MMKDADVRGLVLFNASREDREAIMDDLVAGLGGRLSQPDHRDRDAAGGHCSGLHQSDGTRRTRENRANSLTGSN